MKEYKIEIVKQSTSQSSYSKKMVNLLNQMGEQGWEFRSASGVYWIFDREK
ncbi:MAG: hypothetical protein ACTSP9_12490 [Promethearchaeota archaeon]